MNTITDNRAPIPHAILAPKKPNVASRIVIHASAQKNDPFLEIHDRHP